MADRHASAVRIAKIRGEVGRCFDRFAPEFFRDLFDEHGVRALARTERDELERPRGTAGSVLPRGSIITIVPLASSHVLRFVFRIVGSPSSSP